MINVVGNDPTAVKRCTCKNCSSILEYTRSDTATKRIIDYTGDIDTFRFIQCPKCLKEVGV